MSAKDVKCVVAIYPNYWGKGKTIKEAEQQAKRAGYSPSRRKKVKGEVESVLYLFDVEPDQVTVDSFVDCQINWPLDATAMRLERRY